MVRQKQVLQRMLQVLLLLLLLLYIYIYIFFFKITSCHFRKNKVNKHEPYNNWMVSRVSYVVWIDAWCITSAKCLCMSIPCRIQQIKRWVQLPSLLKTKQLCMRWNIDSIDTIPLVPLRCRCDDVECLSWPLWNFVIYWNWLWMFFATSGVRLLC